MKKVLIIEDNLVLSRVLANWLEEKNLPVKCTASIITARRLIAGGEFSLVLADLRLPDGDGVDLLEWMNNRNYHLPYIIMTDYGEIANAVRAIKLGATDYLCKPLESESLYSVISEALHLRVNTAESRSKAHFYLGRSAAVQECDRLVRLVAPTEMSVLVCGANGTGKEHTARSIHEISRRAKKPFVAVDCGAIPRELAPSEFFGHVKGAFTGAVENKDGLFRTAKGGTLFLDEIGNLGYEAQCLLLRALEEKCYRPVGSQTESTMNVRIIAATNENLEVAIREGRFREDLFHRLDEFTLHVPSLMECRDDILPLAEFFREQACLELKKEVTGFEPKACTILKEYAWPGNIRELRHKVRRAVLLAEGSIARASDLNILEVGATAASTFALRSEEEERERIVRALQLARGNKRMAAGLLEINPSTLYEKIKKHKIET